MKTFSSKISIFGQYLDRRAVRLIITVACLVLFVLAAGAPSGLGGVGMQCLENDVGGRQCGISTTVLEHINENGLEHMSETALDALCIP